MFIVVHSHQICRLKFCSTINSKIPYSQYTSTIRQIKTIRLSVLLDEEVPSNKTIVKVRPEAVLLKVPLPAKNDQF